eukprot:m.125609 g.125609  ORF g.125609 m.125609 type:complete len:57 (+) comp23472_c0_seq2:4860-5030(+)
MGQFSEEGAVATRDDEKSSWVVGFKKKEKKKQGKTRKLRGRAEHPATVPQKREYQK